MRNECERRWQTVADGWQAPGLAATQAPGIRGSTAECLPGIAADRRTRVSSQLQQGLFSIGMIAAAGHDSPADRPRRRRRHRGSGQRVRFRDKRQ